MKTQLQRSDEEIKAKFLSLKNNKDLADLLEVDINTLTYYTYRLPKNKQYIETTILKRSGGVRTILAPTSSLKILQHKINYILQVCYQPRHTTFGFIKNYNAIDNARIHKKPLFVLHIDLKDFFEQIHFGRVKGIFLAKRPFDFGLDISNTIANIATYKGYLPQGAPSSPMISNLICWKLDKEIEEIARNFGCKYTRYADDITISSRKTNCPPQLAKIVGSTVLLGDILLNVFSKHNLIINHEKTSLKNRGQRQMVTGVIVNEKINVKREYIRDIRKDLFIWDKYGIEEASKKHRPMLQKIPYKKAQDYSLTIKGKLNYIKLVKDQDKLDPSYTSYSTLKRWFDYLELRDEFLRQKENKDTQAKGYFLEKAFVKLCLLNGIEVKKSFKRREGADQIDGAIILNGNPFLVECKWTSDYKKINSSIDSFESKIARSSAPGIFISMSGWNKNAIKNRRESPYKNIVLMNGTEFEALINRWMNMSSLLSWKVKALKINAKPFSSIEDYLKENPLKK